MKSESDTQKINQELFGFGKPKKPKAYKKYFLTDTGKREVIKRLKEAQNGLKKLQSEREIFKSISYINWSYKSPTLQNLDNEFEDMESRTKFDINILPPIALKETNKILKYPIADYEGVRAPYDDYDAKDTYYEIVHNKLGLYFDNDSDASGGGITIPHKVLFDGFKDGKDYKVVYIDRDNNILKSTEGYDINNESLKEYSFKPNKEVLANLESVNNKLELNTLEVNIDQSLQELYIVSGINQEATIVGTAHDIIKNAYGLISNIVKLVLLIIREIIRAILPTLLFAFKSLLNFLLWLERIINRRPNREAITDDIVNILNNDNHSYLFPYMYCIPGGITDIPRTLIMYLDTINYNLTVISNILSKGDYNNVKFRSIDPFINIPEGINVDRQLIPNIFNFEVVGSKIKYNVFYLDLLKDFNGVYKYRWITVDEHLNKKYIKFNNWNMNEKMFFTLAKQLVAQKDRFIKARDNLTKKAKELEDSCKNTEKRIKEYLDYTIKENGKVNDIYFTNTKHNLKTIANIAKHSYVTTNKNLNHIIKIFGIYTKYFLTGSNSTQGETK